MLSGKLRAAVLFAAGLAYAGAYGDGQGAAAAPGKRSSSTGSAAPLQVPESAMAALLVSRVKPELLTKGLDATGRVVIAIRVSPDGNVEKATAISGPEALRPSALFAVRQFLYKPYRVNGQPVEVESTVSVDFPDGKPVAPVQTPAAAGAPKAVGSPAAGSSFARSGAAPSAAYASSDAKGVNWVKRRMDEAQPAPATDAGVVRGSALPAPAATVAASSPSPEGARPTAIAKPPAIALSASPAIEKPAPASDAYRAPAPAPAQPVAATPSMPTEWQLVKRVAPQYPAEAELEGIEGVVVVEGIVRKDGTLRELKAVSGPVELRQAAVDAASQFEYAPAGGMRPTTEGTTTTSVEFVLKGPAKVPAEVMAGRIEHNVTPPYPPAAEAAGITGDVTLHVLIDRQGKVEKAEAVDGPMALRETALEAVKQWTWKPYLRRGVDVEVDTTVIVAFTLQHAGQQ